MKYNSFLLISILFTLTSCSSTQPMTNKVDRRASMVGKIENFQYYVSRNIVLTKTQKTNIVGEVAGSASMKLTHNKDVIQITTSTEGVLLNTSVNDRGNKIYYIAFENENDNCLRFVQKSNGDDEQIYLYYDNPAERTVVYGDDVYIVEWDENTLNRSKVRAKIDNFFAKVKGFFKGVRSDNEDYPYLLIKMTTKVKEKEDYRKATGRKVVIQ